MKVIAVGMNYALHNQEMNNLPPDKQPVIFLKPDSALLRDGKPFFIPDFAEQFDYETELVVRISRLGKNIATRYAYRYYDAYTVGIDFTARDLQKQLKDGGLPWALSKGFDGSAAIGEFIPKNQCHDVQDLHFKLEIDGVVKQQGHSMDMLFAVDEIIAYVSRFMTLKMGDLIFTGTPAGVGPVSIGQHLQGYLEDNKVLDFYVR